MCVEWGWHLLLWGVCEVEGNLYQVIAVRNSANGGGGCIEDNGANMVGGEEGMAIFPGKILGPGLPDRTFSVHVSTLDVSS